MSTLEEYKRTSIEIKSEGHLLGGIVTIPPAARGLVLFAHGSGSGRFSPRNEYVAEVLQQHHLATLLFDLLDAAESEDRAKVFDIALLAQRLQLGTAWCVERPELSGLPLCYFGASTGAGAALVAAARQGTAVAAVVSRGGRPDLAGDALEHVSAATLLIVGGDDEPVLTLNRRALARMRCQKQLTVIPGATHLFAEQGALPTVANLAAQWFVHHVPVSRNAAEHARPIDF